MRQVYLLLSAFFLLAICTTGYTSEIYKWTDANGRVHYGDKRPQGTPQDTNVERVTPKTNTMAATPAKQVTMYATSWCGYCAKARQFFKQNSIAYTEYDIEKDSQAKQRYDAMGARGIPVILIGDQRINGFDQARLEALLK